ncbi:alpha-2-macroglobulin [Terrihabitans soli]|uniref:Alpha-2-macroglobulin n=1 Tax=Terrihabitans soli TaxID=708113 RepID=A0A6S6QJ12_9HYPH|nr:alpha-2-macroglobulin [Terrihabitans soli]BCJ90244.1 alpha-2-macroglobulin [Terrihabitans soli]
MTSVHRFVFVLFALVFALLPMAADAKPFDKPYLNTDANRYEREIINNTATADRTLDDWIKEGVEAVKKDDWRAALNAFGAAIAVDPKSEQAWRNYAISLLRVKAESSETYEFPGKAKASAYRAYLLSKDAKAEARNLAILAEAYTRAEEYRQALNAYKESLKLFDHPEVRAAYQTALEEHGFRVTNYSVDADTASPRACMEFSENLAKGRVDFAPFVSVVGMDKPAVAAENDKLCVDGLKHGETYEVNVRAGVPSALGENSLKPANATIYVRDRKPDVRFTGKNYVLPRTGQQGIPFVSVNVDRVAVKIFRVGDRGMGPEITNGKFQAQLDKSEFDKLQADSGAKIFEGEIDVTKKLNEEITTAVPLDETIKTMEPGVYVMTARAYDSQENDDYETQPTQWFVVSDIGLTALSSGDGIHAFVRSLAGAQALEGVELKLVARNNEVLATAKSDANGYVRFEKGLTKGEGGLSPAVLTASLAGDYGFLALTAAGFDLSDRGVEGRAAPGPLDALVYTERGVYRPGEQVHVTTLLRNADGLAVENLPLTLVFERPDGAEERREVLEDEGAGGRAFSLPLVSDATTGTWRVKAYAELKQPPVGEATFLVEDYVPERLDMDVTTTAKTMTAAGIPVELDGRWLYGAPAGDLAIEGNVSIRSSSAEIAGLAGYKFGLADEEVSPVTSELNDLAKTDANGKAKFDVPQPNLPNTTKPLEARIAVRLREPGGRTIERQLTLPVASTSQRIGVKPLFGEQVAEGQLAEFDVRVLAADNAFAAAKGLRWELSRLNTRYQWYSEGSDWNYETITTATRTADGVVDADAKSPARISSKLGYGRYRLDVMSAEPNGPATSIVFTSGWNPSADNAETPDTLEVALDKDLYAPGDKAELRIDAPFAGKATVVVVGNEVISSKVLDLTQGENEIALDVTEAWRPGAYVMAFLHRPLDAKASRMPGRAIGLAHAQIDAAPHTLKVALSAPDKAPPRGTVRVPVKIANLASGEKAHLVVAAVDVGILNLTGFKAPAPEEDAFAQRQLSAEVRDLYGQLIDGMRAARGKIRTGGDDMGGMGMGEPPTQQPLALFSGLVPVAADGTAEVSFDIPAFNGTVKLMAIAWSKDKLGHSEQDVVIADPVVVTAALPRFLAPGDASRLRLDIHNVSGAAGEYKVKLDGAGDVISFNEAEQKLALKDGERKSVEIALTAKAVGRSSIDVSLTAPDGKSYAQALNLPVQPASPEGVNRTVVQLAPKTGSISVTSDMLKDYVPGTASIALTVGSNAAFEPAAFAGALDTYPYGCSEQLSSKLIAILYAEDYGIKLADDTREKAQQMIGRVLARQSSNGGFGLWSAGTDDDLWLDSYVVDVLTRAREKGYAVSERAISSGLARLKNVLGYEGEFDDQDEATNFAYAHYVLARNGRPIVGDLRYLADSKVNEIASPLARAQIGAALALAGDQARAGKAFAAADTALGEINVDQVSRLDYGTDLRDSAGVLALAAETSIASVIPAVAKKVVANRGARNSFSTQENAWLLRASQALKQESAKLSLTVNGAAHAGVYNKTLDAVALVEPVKVGNASDVPVNAMVTVRGAPKAMPPATEMGLKVTRAYYTLAGEEVDPSKVAQNTRLVVVLQIEETAEQNGRLLVVDHLPGGFEIDNPRLVTSAEVKLLPWLDQNYAPGHAEFRDDRFVAAFNRTGEDTDMVAAYIVRAVSPGTYVHPPATVEDMYRIERFGRSDSGTVEVTAK